jgi:hypothetical protein
LSFNFPCSESTDNSGRIYYEEETSVGWLVTFLAGEELKVNVRGSEDIAIAEDFTQAITVGTSRLRASSAVR